MITEHGTDEDTALCGKIADVAVNTFMRRRPVLDKVREAIARFANDALYLHRNRQGLSCCDAVFLLLSGTGFTWLISGGAKGYHLFDGKLSGPPAEDPAPMLGEKPVFHPGPAKVTEMKKGTNAFFLASPVLAEKLTPELLERTYAGAGDAQAWIRNVVGEIGEERQYCANAVILPPKRPVLPLIVAAVILIAALVWLLVKRKTGV